jgi:hypothetical protein
VHLAGWSGSTDNLLRTEDNAMATLTATTDDPSLMIPTRVAAPSLPFPAINPLERAGSDTVRHANPLFDSFPPSGDVEHGDRLSSLNSAQSHGPTPASDVLGGALAFAMEVGRRGVQVTNGSSSARIRNQALLQSTARGDSGGSRKWGVTHGLGGLPCDLGVGSLRRTREHTSRTRRRRRTGESTGRWHAIRLGWGCPSATQAHSCLCLAAVWW